MNTVAIGELFEYVIGGGWGSETPTKGTVPVRVIRGADFPEAALQNVEKFPHRFESKNAVIKRQLIPGDIVLEISGGTRDRPTGRTVYVTEGMVRRVDAALIPASFCRLVRPNSERAHPRWLYYLIQNWWNGGGAWLYQNQSTGISNFRFKVFSDVLRVSLPTRGRQAAIAEVLGALDDKVSANRVVTKGALVLGESLVRKGQLSQAMLTDVADVNMGSSPKGEFLNEDGVGMHFYQGVRDFGTVFPTSRVSTSSPVRVAPEGATLFAVRAPVGEVNLAVEEVCIGRGLASLVSKERPATLHFCIRAFQEVWDEHQGGGTVFASVNGRDVREAQLPMPEDSEGRLERSLRSLLDRAVQAEQESICLTRTRDELLPALMLGKITVKDAEKTVEEVV